MPLETNRDVDKPGIHPYADLLYMAGQAIEQETIRTCHGGFDVFLHHTPMYTAVQFPRSTTIQNRTSEIGEIIKILWYPCRVMSRCHT